MKLRFLALTVTLLLLVGSVAVSSPKEIDLWSPFAVDHPTGKTVVRLVEEFNAHNPDIKVTYTYIQSRDQLRVAMAGGLTGDALVLAGFLIPNRAQMPEMLLPLQPLLERDGLTDTYFPEALEYYSWDGMPYGAPYSLDLNFPLLINNSLMQSFGLDYTDITSTDRLMAAMKRLTRYNAADELETVGMQPWYMYGLNQGLLTWTVAFGGQLSDGFGYTLTNPAAEEALQWVNEYVDSIQGGAPAANALTGGLKLAPDPSQVVIQPHILSYMTQQAEAYPNVDFEVIPVPSSTPNESSIWLGGFAMGVARNASDSDAAWEFVKWATSSVEAAEITKDGRLSGAVRPHQEGVYEVSDRTNTVNRLRDEYRKLVQHIRFQRHPAIYYWGELSEVVEAAVVNRTHTPNGALAEWNRVLNARLERELQE